ncbi:hypothetical protein DYB26_000242 [Aphanomyces astaci]|uniref:Uncharacterized protein n=1 Tax=Aphanomyces astaci TaxID=112090 RepID=A0A418EIF5_APHAT|nr:hypothetical protein DYB26_000242 [Aphanomyces astaci]
MGRLGALVSPLKAELANIMCLQEFWFDETYMRTFQSHFPNFSCYASKRPGLKEDGLAIFIDHSKLTIHNFRQLDFDKAGERVAMLMHLSFLPNSLPSHTLSFMERSFLLINTHLTFPHSDINRVMRMNQIETMLSAVQEYQRKEHLEQCPVIMCGDFNDIYDPVHNLVISHGFQSVFAEVGVDFIFSYNPQPPPQPLNDLEKRVILLPNACDLLPRSLPDSTRLKRPEFLPPKTPWEAVQAEKAARVLTLCHVMAMDMSMDDSLSPPVNHRSQNVQRVQHQRLSRDHVFNDGDSLQAFLMHRATHEAMPRMKAAEDSPSVPTRGKEANSLALVVTKRHRGFPAVEPGGQRAEGTDAGGVSGSREHVDPGRPCAQHADSAGGRHLPPRDKTATDESKLKSDEKQVCDGVLGALEVVCRPSGGFNQAESVYLAPP